MCAKAISTNGAYIQSLEAKTESSMSDNSLPTLEEFGSVLEGSIGTSVSVLGANHIRISTPHIATNDEIQNLKDLISNSLHLPVTIFRERTYVEIAAI